MATGRKGRVVPTVAERAPEGERQGEAAEVIPLDRRRRAKVPEELERKGLLFFEILDEREADVDARIKAISERLADIGKAICPIGLELATRPRGPLLEIAAFPATAFGSYEDAVRDAMRKPKADA